ncbi:tyramine oxidase subunit B [Nocardia brasiliensis]|uniref:tyramine oxidase subunit B n=1 Tax=Nocardia brasiliensis TaxID=37326 RepID=UPI003D9055BB
MDKPSIDFLYLSEPDMIAAGVTDMAACVDAMQETFVLLHQGDYRMAGPNSDSHGAMITFPDDSPFPAMPANTPERRFMAMPAYLGGSFGTAGMKWYGSNIANRAKGLPRSILMFLLSDTDTGAPLALMSANLLSAYRTGAVPGVGARLLARRDSRVVGLVGPGVMARTSLAAFVAACPDLAVVKIKGRGQGSIAAFREWVAKEYPQLETIVVDTNEEAVRDSDIVTYCTTGVPGDPANYPLIVRDWVRPGAFLSMPAPCDIDTGMQAPEIRKVVDNVRLYQAWAEEVGHPSHHRIPIVGCKFMDMIQAGAMDESDLVDLGAIAAGAATGRRTDEEIVLLSVGGMPVEDVAWGTVVYRNAVRRGIGTTLNLWQSPELA